MKGSVYKRGATWTAHIEFQDNTGKRRQRKRGGFRTEKLADLEVRKMLRAVDLGIAAAPDRITFGQYLKEWIDHREAMGSLERTTLDSYREKIRNYLEPMAGEIALQQLSAMDLDRTYRQMAERGLSARTIRYTHSIARKALSDAERLGVIEVNPAARANPPSSRSAQAPKFRVWSLEELATFLAYVEGKPYGVALAFAARTGVRRGEVCGLRWADLELSGDNPSATIRSNVVEVRGGGLDVKAPKSHRARAVSLDRTIVEQLRRHRVEQAEWRLAVGAGWRDLDLVFSQADGSYLRPDVLTRAFRRHAEGAELPIIRLHDLRHGHATELVEGGTDPATVSSRLGHATTQFTLDVYVKPSQDRQAAAVRSLADRLDAAISLPGPYQAPSGALVQVHRTW